MEWSGEEKRLLEAVKDGKDYVGSREKEAGPSVISAAVLSWLCREGSEEVVRRVGLRVCGVHITGKLDLRETVVRFPLRFRNCCFGEPIDLRGARCRRVELQECTVPGLAADEIHVYGDLELSACWCDRIDLGRAVVRGDLVLAGCHIPRPGADQGAPSGVSGAGALIHGDVNLRWLKARSPVNLRRSTIHGRITALAARLVSKEGPALRLEEARVERNVDLKLGFQADGGVALEGSRIAGNLDCRGGVFMVPEKPAEQDDALGLREAVIGGDLLLKPGYDRYAVLHPFRARGRVHLFRITVEGNLECNGADLQARGAWRGIRKYALDVEEARIGGGALLTAYNGREDVNARFLGPQEDAATLRFRSLGVVSFRRARIGRDLSCQGAMLNGFSRRGSGYVSPALLATEARIGGNLLLCQDLRFGHRFLGRGGVELDRVQVEGKIDCGGGLFLGDDLKASSTDTDLRCYTRSLSIRGARIGGSVFLCEPKGRSAEEDCPSQPFIAVGRVSLARSEVGKVVSCKRARFVRRLREDETGKRNPEIPSGLILNDVDIASNLEMSEARLHADLMGKGAHRPLGRAAVEAKGLNVAGVGWLDLDPEDCGTGLVLALKGASFGKLLVHPKTSWTKPENLQIDGMTYPRLQLGPDKEGGDSLKNDRCKEWLALQYPEEGDRGERSPFRPQPHRQLIAALHSMGYSQEARELAIDKRRREIQRLPCYARYVYTAFQWPIGYGYKPWQVLWFMVGLFVLGSAWFFAAREFGAIQPSQATRPPSFAPVTYAADTMLPIIDLHQEKYFTVHEIEMWKFPLEQRLPSLLAWPLLNLFRLYLWFHIVGGWILTTIAVAGLTGIVKTE